MPTTDTAKISPPSVYHALLPRTRIAAVIDGASPGEAVCLVAPYGCGKTMAVLSWLRGHDWDAAWLSLDTSDDSEEALAAGLSSALLRFLGRDAQSTGTDVIGDPKGFLWDTVTAAEREKTDRVLVIDGVHFLHASETLRFIKDFVTALLGRWRVVLISRAELPYGFNDMLLKRQICLISHAELSFDAGETGDFFRVNGCDPSEQRIAQIREETEGWPAALNVILILSRGGEVVYGEAARGYLRGFFETEIWSGLPNDIRDFLLKTSVLDILTPATCNAVTELGATRPSLRWLYVNGMFLSHLGERDTYRYHRVFRVFLQEKLDASGLGVQPLYAKIAWWHFERNEPEDAFPYFFAARDYYGLSRVLRILNLAHLGYRKYLSLMHCLTELDIDALHGHPLVMARIALIHYLLGNLTEMQNIYQLLLCWEAPGELRVPPEEYAEYMWELGWLGYLNPDEPIEKNERHLEWIQYAEYEPSLRQQQDIRGAYTRNHSVLSGLRDHCPTLRSIEDFVRDNDGSISDRSALMQIDIIRAEYAYEQERFPKAEQLIRAVLEQAEKLNMADICFICISVLTKITRATRGTGGIKAMTAYIEKMICKSGYDFMWPRFHTFEQQNMLAEGFCGQTEAFAAENKDYMDHPTILNLWNHITLSRALISTGDIDEASILLTRLEDLCLRYSRIRDKMEVAILQSIADYKLGNKAIARERLAAAIEAAREYGFIRIFSDEARELWPILELLDASDPYIKSILISCKKTLARTGVKPETTVKTALTKTEHKILRALVTEMSYEEIALDNKIKLSTVKSHLHSIYEKLGAAGRSAAVAVAREAGLVD